MFFAHEDKFIVTPTYHVFEMYAAHQGAQALRTEVMSSRPTYQRNGKPATMQGLNGSASLRDKTLTLTVTNPSLTDAQATEIALRGATAKDVQVVTLTARDIQTHNSFENPRAIEPRAGAATINGGAVRCSFAPASVTRLQITLA